MSDQTDLVTVFRSGDASAADDAAAVLDILVDSGFNPAMFSDEAPGVPPGAYEVRVPAGEEAQALAAIDQASEPQPAAPGDTSHSLDLVDVYSGLGTHAEMEAYSIRTVLDAYHIPSVLAGTSQMPNLPFQVKVPAVCHAAAVAALEEAASSPLAEPAEA